MNLCFISDEIQTYLPVYGILSVSPPSVLDAVSLMITLNALPDQNSGGMLVPVGPIGSQRSTSLKSAFTYGSLSLSSSTMGHRTDSHMEAEGPTMGGEAPGAYFALSFVTLLTGDVYVSRQSKKEVCCIGGFSM